MRIESKNGKTTNFESYGENTNIPILLIHGLGAEISSWKNQIEEFPKNEFYVITLDMYGHGQSSNLTDKNLEEWNIQILNLLDYLKIDKLIICGVSMEAVISQYFTIIYCIFSRENFTSV